MSFEKLLYRIILVTCTTAVAASHLINQSPEGMWYDSLSIRMQPRAELNAWEYQEGQKIKLA
jgi:hypothetical protein